MLDFRIKKLFITELRKGIKTYLLQKTKRIEEELESCLTILIDLQLNNFKFFPQISVKSID